jgi:hypothetical protein
MNSIYFIEAHLSEFGVETAVDDGVVGRMRHGEPVTCEQDDIDLLVLPNRLILFAEHLHTQRGKQTPSN